MTFTVKQSKELFSGVLTTEVVLKTAHRFQHSTRQYCHNTVTQSVKCRVLNDIAAQAAESAVLFIKGHPQISLGV